MQAPVTLTTPRYRLELALGDRGEVLALTAPDGTPLLAPGGLRLVPWEGAVALPHSATAQVKRGEPPTVQVQGLRWQGAEWMEGTLVLTCHPSHLDLVVEVRGPATARTPLVVLQGAGAEPVWRLFPCGGGLALACGRLTYRPDPAGCTRLEVPGPTGYWEGGPAGLGWARHWLATAGPGRWWGAAKLLLICTPFLPRPAPRRSPPLG